MKKIGLILLIMGLFTSMVHVYGVMAADVDDSTLLPKEDKFTEGIIRGRDNDNNVTDNSCNMDDIVKSNNYATIVDYCGFNKTSSSIRGYATTKLIPIDPLDPPKTWDIVINCLLWKNGHVYNRADKKAIDSLSLRVDTPYDYSSRTGDSYEVESFHRVYDYYGTIIWDQEHLNSTNF